MFDLNSPCTFCSDKAIYYILDVMGGTKKEWRLCAACMNKYDKSGYLKLFALPLIDLKAALGISPHQQAQQTDVECPKCGMTLSRFMRTKRVGCDQDYELFQLGHVLKEYHKAEQHVGKFPQDQKVPPEVINDRLENLKTAMKEAINAEKYEDAARLRDEIQSLQKELQ